MSLIHHLDNQKETQLFTETTFLPCFFQSILMMEETKPFKKLPEDSPYAVTITNGTFAWDKPGSGKKTLEEKEELVFTTNEDGSVLCFPNGSIENLPEASNPNGDVPHVAGEDVQEFTSPEEVPLRIDDETKAKHVSWNGSVVVGKDAEDVIKEDGAIQMTDVTKKETEDKKEEKVVQTLHGIDIKVEKVI